MAKKKACIVTVKSSRYNGTIDGIRENKIHMSNLISLHKDGLYKAVSGNRSLNKRWFNLASVREILPYTSPEIVEQILKKGR